MSIEINMSQVGILSSKRKMSVDEVLSVVKKLKAIVFLEVSTDFSTDQVNVLTPDRYISLKRDTVC